MFFVTALVIAWMVEKLWRLRTKQAHASLVLCDNTANAQEFLCTLKDGTYWKCTGAPDTTCHLALLRFAVMKEQQPHLKSFKALPFYPSLQGQFLFTLQ